MVKIMLSKSEVGTMTIQEALQKYKDQGPDSIYPGYRDAIDVLVANHVSTPLENDSYLDALFLTNMMFSKANHCLCVLSGGGVDHFLDALKVPFEKALERIQKTSGKARVIVLDAALPASLSELAKKFNGTLEVRTGKAIAPLKHFIVCDSAMVRVEEPHQPLTLASNCDEVKAKVYFDNTAVASARLGFFDAAWKQLENS